MTADDPSAPRGRVPAEPAEPADGDETAPKTTPVPMDEREIRERAATDDDDDRTDRLV